VEGKKGQGGHPGGLSTGLLSADELDTCWTSTARSGPESGLGRRRVVLDETYSMIDFLHTVAGSSPMRAAASAPLAGKRTHWALSMSNGSRPAGRLKDLDLLLEIADSIASSRNDDLRPGRRAPGRSRTPSASFAAN